jgi:hypothetical protein
MATMVELTPHDAAVLSRLVQFDRLPIEKRREILGELESPEAREVGEIVLDSTKLSTASEQIRETVNRYQLWLENNKRLGRIRRGARRSK